MKANLENRIQQIEAQVYKRKCPNRDLTKEEEEDLFRALEQEFSQPDHHLSDCTAEEEAELRDFYVKELQRRQSRKEQAVKEGGADDAH